jgi:hypothetical protein
MCGKYTYITYIHTCVYTYIHADIHRTTPCTEHRYVYVYAYIHTDIYRTYTEQTHVQNTYYTDTDV